MYGNEMFKKGVYGIIDTTTGKVVYVGSTNTSFVSRWGYHSSAIRDNKHSNKQLVVLIDSGNFEFVIIQAGEFTSKELLESEKYYTDLYDTYNNGYCVHIGGGRLKPIFDNVKTYEYDKTSKTIRKYIEANWFQKKIYKEDKDIIEKYLIKNGIQITKFMAVIKNLGYAIQRYADKRSWLISEKLY